MRAKSKAVLWLMAVMLFGWHLPEVQGGDLTVPDALNLLDGALGSIRSFDVNVSSTSRRFIITEGKRDAGTGDKKQFITTNRRELRAGELPTTSQEYFH